MSRFGAPRIRFGRPVGPAPDTVPAPLVTQATTRRTAQLAEAADVLTAIPGPGAALHALMTGRYDLMHLLAVLVDRVGAVEDMRIATLSFNSRNLAEMLTLLDGGKVKTLTLLGSAFFRDHNKDLWVETLTEFRQRNQRAAAARSHAKVVTIALADGRRLALEGSANLRTNSNREQFVLLNDAAVHDWHAGWIDALVSVHAGAADRHTHGAGEGGT